MSGFAALELLFHNFFFMILFQNGYMYTTLYIPTTGTEHEGESVYTFYTKPQTWNTARRVCASIGARLAKLDTEERLRTATYAVLNASTYMGNDIWVGLHRNANESLTNDLDCTFLNVSISGLNVFDGFNEYIFDNNAQCFQLHLNKKALQKHDCARDIGFLCQRTTGTRCPFFPISAFPTIVSVANASSSVCQSICELQPACYLSGNYSTNHCVMLSGPSESTIMMHQYCPIYVTVNDSNTDGYQGADDQDKTPGTCTSLPDPEVSSSTTSISPASVSSDEVIIPSSSCDVIYTMTTQSLQHVTQTVTLPAIIVTLTEPTTIEKTNVLSATPLTIFVTLTETNVQHETITDVLTTCSQVLPTTSTSSQELQTTSMGVISLFPTASGPVMQQTEVCKTFNITTVQEASLKKMTESISSKLIIETKNLSRSIRQKTSASDLRPSSQSIGYVAIAIAVVPLFLALMVDIPLVLQHVQGAFVNIQSEGTVKYRRTDPRKIRY